MAQWLFFAAGGLSALWLMVHVVMGGKEIVRPALGPSGLAPVVRDTLYICWHYTTASIAVKAALFLWAGVSLDTTGAATATALAAAFSLVGIALVPRQGGRYRDLPQGWLFVPVAALGGVGLLL